MPANIESPLNLGVLDVKTISDSERLPMLMGMAVAYAKALPSDERARNGRELHAELRVLLQEGAITHAEYDDVLLTALGWNQI